MALSQLRKPSKFRREAAMLAQWTLGLTGKGVQNVLRGDHAALDSYVTTFETALVQAAESIERRIGPLRLSISAGTGSGASVGVFDWRDFLRLTTTLGCAELAIRGSDKSRYGKLFERLVLGSVLTILGFRLDDRKSGGPSEQVFWLSDSSDDRECDATVIVRPGVVARFDLGFIGVGNPEIVRDKLSRFSREIERGGRTSASTTFVIVDRYPDGPTATSRRLAEHSGTVLIQMSMSVWPSILAKELKARLGYSHPLASKSDAKAAAHLRGSIQSVDVMQFLGGGANTEDRADPDQTESE